MFAWIKGARTYKRGGSRAVIGSSVCVCVYRDDSVDEIRVFNPYSRPSFAEYSRVGVRVIIYLRITYSRRVSSCTASERIFITYVLSRCVVTRR